MKLTLLMCLSALVFLGSEVPEDTSEESARALVAEKFAELGLNPDDLLTEPTMFTMGFHRGLSGRAIKVATDLPVGHGKAELNAFENGVGFGIEARDLAVAPPPRLLYAAFQTGEVKWGGLAEWTSARAEELKSGFRLKAALTVGSGKTQVVVPAGTPVDVLNNGFDKDGVNHIIVAYDGLALIVPSPSSDPAIVSADTVLTKAAAPRKASARKQKDGQPSAPREKVERGPTLHDVIVDVLEGADGGPGMLDTNVGISQRVFALARERGISEKAQTFLAKPEKHAPYYAGAYAPIKVGTAGRLNVLNPLEWVIAAAQARKFYLRASGTHEERLKAIPPELVARMQDKTTRRANVPAYVVTKASASSSEATAGATPVASAGATPVASDAAPAKKSRKKPAASASAAE